MGIPTKVRARWRGSCWLATLSLAACGSNNTENPETVIDVDENTKTVVDVDENPEPVVGNVDASWQNNSLVVTFDAVSQRLSDDLSLTIDGARKSLDVVSGGDSTVVTYSLSDPAIDVDWHTDLGLHDGVATIDADVAKLASLEWARWNGDRIVLDFDAPASVFAENGTAPTFSVTNQSGEEYEITSIEIGDGVVSLFFAEGFWL